MTDLIERARKAAANPESGSFGAIVTELAAALTAVGPQGGAEPLLTGVGWENLTCDDQFALATRIAANVGYALVPERSIQDAEDNLHPIVFVPTNRLLALTDATANVPMQKTVSSEFAYLWTALFASPPSPAIEVLREALHNAKVMLVTLGGDPRSIIAEHGSGTGDEMQAAMLDQIDAALHPESTDTRIRELEAKLTKAAEALRPFSRVSGAFSAREDGSFEVWRDCHEPVVRAMTKLYNFRLAASTLKEIEPNAS